jgi:hypothetical protein
VFNDLLLEAGSWRFATFHSGIEHLRHVYSSQRCEKKARRTRKTRRKLGIVTFAVALLRMGVNNGTGAEQDFVFLRDLRVLRAFFCGVAIKEGQRADAK